ncbi:MAG: TRAP transporter small permease, partial [Bacillota bacterium]|nr:TRAP transporter small permease [Bacillota bacterium]
IGIVFIQVFARFVLKGSLPWSEELARYIMIWAVLIGASIAAREGAHIGISALIDKLPQSMKKPFIVIGGLITVAFSVFLCYLAIIVVMFISSTGQKSPAMFLPMYFAYAAIPVGAALMTIRFAQLAINKLKVEGR